jgi:hypothetical protein
VGWSNFKISIFKQSVLLGYPPLIDELGAHFYNSLPILVIGYSDNIDNITATGSRTGL